MTDIAGLGFILVDQIEEKIAPILNEYNITSQAEIREIAEHIDQNIIYAEKNRSPEDLFKFDEKISLEYNKDLEQLQKHIAGLISIVRKKHPWLMYDIIDQIKVMDDFSVEDFDKSLTVLDNLLKLEKHKLFKDLFDNKQGRKVGGITKFCWCVSEVLPSNLEAIQKGEIISKVLKTVSDIDIKPRNAAEKISRNPNLKQIKKHPWP